MCIPHAILNLDASSFSFQLYRKQEERGVAEAEMAGWRHDAVGLSWRKLREIGKDREACVLQSVGLQSRTQPSE